MVDPSFWTNEFEMWRTFRPSPPVHMMSSEVMLMVPLATTARGIARYLDIVELNYGASFSLDYDGLIQYIAEDAIGQAVHDWKVFREEAAAAGFVAGDGRLLLALLS